MSFRPAVPMAGRVKGALLVVRYIGMDVHREFAQLAVVEDGLVRDEGRIGVTPEALRQWAAGLRGDDQVALEATGNSDAIANLLIPLVGRVVVSNPSKTRAIAEAKVKTDKVAPGSWRSCWPLTSCRRSGCPMSGPGACAVRSTAARTSCGSAPDRTRCTRSWPATWLPRPRCRTCSARPAGTGCHARTCPPTSARPCTRCCGSWTSTAASSRPWTGNWPSRPSAIPSLHG